MHICVTRGEMSYIHQRYPYPCPQRQAYCEDFWELNQHITTAWHCICLFESLTYIQWDMNSCNWRHQQTAEKGCLYCQWFLNVTMLPRIAYVRFRISHIDSQTSIENSIETLQLSHYGNIVMQSFSFNILDIDGNDDMFNDIRKCLQISPSLMDGHCFLYSIVKSCHSQLTPSCDINVAFILRKMRSELTTSPDEYTGFKIDSDIIAVKTAFNFYAFDKKYNTYFGDTVPLLCANSLGINIGVLDDSHNSSSKVIFSRNKTKACVFIRKNGDHYDGLIPMKHMCDNLREPLW